MFDSHLELGLIESAAAEPVPFERWAARLEKILGFDLDGNRETDGYSVDCCYDMFKQGKTPLQASYVVLWRKNGLHKPSP